MWPWDGKRWETQANKLVGESYRWSEHCREQRWVLEKEEQEPGPWVFQTMCHCWPGQSYQAMAFWRYTHPTHVHVQNAWQQLDSSSVTRQLEEEASAGPTEPLLLRAWDQMVLICSAEGRHAKRKSAGGMEGGKQMIINVIWWLWGDMMTRTLRIGLMSIFSVPL